MNIMEHIVTECPHCKFLHDTFNFDDLAPREYWLFTEMFVYLHSGKDYCDYSAEIEKE
jgi:hypothetical protein